MTLISTIKNMIGIDPDYISDIEQECIEVLNDNHVRKRIFTHILHNTPYSYFGSYFVCRGKDLIRMRAVNPDMLSISQFIKKIKTFNGKGIFTCAGCIVRNQTEYSHHLSFVWNSQTKELVCFCPGWNIIGVDMINMVLEGVQTGLRPTNTTWNNPEYGPQDFTNRWYPTLGEPIPPLLQRTDSFCQSWTILWVKEYVAGNTGNWITYWGSSSAVLTDKIRKFIIWIDRFGVFTDIEKLKLHYSK